MVLLLNIIPTNHPHAHVTSFLLPKSKWSCPDLGGEAPDLAEQPVSALRPLWPDACFAACLNELRSGSSALLCAWMSPDGGFQC